MNQESHCVSCGSVKKHKRENPLRELWVVDILITEVFCLELSLNNNFIVSQDNRIIQNISRDVKRKPSRNSTFMQESFLLDQYQKRLVLLLVSHISPNTKAFQQEIISFKDYCSIMNIPRGGRTQKSIEASVDDLARKTFTITDENGITWHHWVESGTRVDWATKTIHIKLAESLRPYFVELKKSFTSYQLGFTRNFKSKYTFRLYEYLRSYLAQGIITIKIENAYEVFCDNRYKFAYDLERFVLDKSIAEINEFSDIRVKYKKIKNGKAITHLTFVISEKTSEEIGLLKSNWEAKQGRGLDLLNSKIAEAFPDEVVIEDNKSVKL